MSGITDFTVASSIITISSTTGTNLALSKTATASSINAATAIPVKIEIPLDSHFSARPYIPKATAPAEPRIQHLVPIPRDKSLKAKCLWFQKF
jgi:hypothetical protein